MSTLKHKPLSVSYADILAAETRIRSALHITPLTYSPQLSQILKREIHIKWDNKHRTGSFKERGAVNALSLLTLAEKRRGVISASAGNHAQALAYHAARYGIPCRIVMPAFTPLVKVQATRNFGAEVILHGEHFMEAQDLALQICRSEHLRFVHPFNDPAIVAGQGTLALEVVSQLSDFDAVVVPVGGGGLVSGIALALKQLKPKCKIIGVQSQWATSHIKRSPAAKRQVFSSALSIADGIAVKALGAITSKIIARHVDSLVQVSENHIARAIIAFLEQERSVVEGAGAAALAALLAGLVPKNLKRLVVVACGSNIDVNVLARLIERDLSERGRLLRLRASVPDRPGLLAALADIMGKSGANILQVGHDRSFSHVPGNVDITLVIEVRDKDHARGVFHKLKAAGVTVELKNQ
jgi:threonine dehydratase